MKTYLQTVLITVLATTFIFTQLSAKTYFARDHIIQDLTNNLEWLRCSVGQQWNGDTCTGDALLMDHETIKIAITIANEQLGGDWRLPSLKELLSLVCQECKKRRLSSIPTINAKYFPNTDPRAYWTGEQNKMSKGSYWTVNFFTGHKFGRFYPYQQMAVRLVRDR